MSWMSDEAYRRGLEVMSAVVESVPGDAWERPSPCAGWRAVDVLGHVGEATRMGARILTGAEVSFSQQDTPGDAVEGDPSKWWEVVAADGRAAIATVGQDDLDRVVDSPMGPRAIRDGLRFPAADLFLHAWDIGRSVGVDVAIPDEAVLFIRSLGDAVPEEAMRSPGVFGPVVPVPADASEVDRLLGWTGRDPAWVATTS